MLSKLSSIADEKLPACAGAGVVVDGVGAGSPVEAGQAHALVDIFLKHSVV